MPSVTLVTINNSNHGSRLVTAFHFSFALSDFHILLLSPWSAPPPPHTHSLILSPAVNVWKGTIITVKGCSVHGLTQDPKKMSSKLTLMIDLCVPEWRAA